MWSKEIDELGMLNDTQRNLKCSRILNITLATFMIFILVGGIAIFGIAVWTHEVEYGSKAIGGLVGVALYQIDSVMLICCGSLTTIIMIVGLFGLLMPQKCLLGFHLSVMTFVAFALFAAGILGYVFVGELEDSVRGSLKKSVTEYYGIPDENSRTFSWDHIQQKFECCGAYGGQNTTTSWYLYQFDSFWYKDKYNQNGSLVPKSCCAQATGLDLCTGINENVTQKMYPPYAPPPVLEKSSNYTLYMDGCFDKLKDYLHQNGIMVGTASVVVGVFMVRMHAQILESF